MSASDVIELLIEPVIKDLGEFTVRRALPDERRQRVGPFIFFDHMGPAQFPPDSGVNVRAHPHIALQRSPICLKVKSCIATVSATFRRFVLVLSTG